MTKENFYLRSLTGLSAMPGMLDNESLWGTGWRLTPSNREVTIIDNHHPISQECLRDFRRGRFNRKPQDLRIRNGIYRYSAQLLFIIIRL